MLPPAPGQRHGRVRAALIRLIALTTCLAGPPVPAAFAQIDPDDIGAGIQLGLAAEHNSGQVGTVTLLARGPQHTLVLLAVESVPPRGSESARLARRRSCEGNARAPAPRFALTPVAGRTSSSLVALPLGRLLSGNYIAEVFAQAPYRRVSCGELHR